MHLLFALTLTLKSRAAVKLNQTEIQVLLFATGGLKLLQTFALQKVLMKTSLLF